MTKHYHVEVENAGPLSILVLQAKVLMALYEMGHGIYPAAYMSVGACARYGYAMGIPNNQMAGIKRLLTLVEVEEQRRVWWAVVILDRQV